MGVDQIVSYVTAVVAVVGAIAAFIKAARRGGVDGVITALGRFAEVVGSQPIKKVKCSQEELDIVYEQLSSGEITDEGVAVIQSIVQRIVDAYGDDPQVQSVMTSVLSSILSYTSKTVLKRAYKQYGLQVLAVVETFAEAES